MIDRCVQAYIQWTLTATNGTQPKSAATSENTGFISDAIAALEDELSLVMFDERTTDEQRMIALGMDVFGRVLVVIFVWKGEKIRLISARKATKRERAQYGVS